MGIAIRKKGLKGMDLCSSPTHVMLTMERKDKIMTKRYNSGNC